MRFLKRAWCWKELPVTTTATTTSRHSSCTYLPSYVGSVYVGTQRRHHLDGQNCACSQGTFRVKNFEESGYQSTSYQLPPHILSCHRQQPHAAPSAGCDGGCRLSLGLLVGFAFALLFLSSAIHSKNMSTSLAT